MNLFFYACHGLLTPGTTDDWTTGLVEADSRSEAEDRVRILIAQITDSSPESSCRFFVLSLSDWDIDVLKLRQACNTEPEDEPILQPFFYLPQDFDEALRDTILVHGRSAEGAVLDVKTRVSGEMAIGNDGILQHGRVVPIISQQINYRRGNGVHRGKTATLIVLRS